MSRWTPEVVGLVSVVTKGEVRAPEAVTGEAAGTDSKRADGGGGVRTDTGTGTGMGTGIGMGIGGGEGKKDMGRISGADACAFKRMLVYAKSFDFDLIGAGD